MQNVHQNRLALQFGIDSVSLSKTTSDNGATNDGDHICTLNGGEAPIDTIARIEFALMESMIRPN